MANVRKLKFGLKCLTIFPILIFYKYYYLDGVEPLYYYQKNEKDDNQNLFNSKIVTTTTIEITESNVTTAIPPKISEQLETQKILKVIILSVNPRSGSTYLSGTQSFTTSLMTYHLVFCLNLPKSKQSSNSF